MPDLANYNRIYVYLLDQPASYLGLMTNDCLQRNMQSKLNYTHLIDAVQRGKTAHTKAPIPVISGGLDAKGLHSKHGTK